MAYSYKGSISFGLVYIPVKLHSSVRSNDIGFNMLDKKTMSRVRYKKTCEACEGREVKQADIVKGYEYEDGKYVVFDSDDFERLKTKRDKNINIEKFVNLSEVDPLYFDKPYYVEATGADRAFAVLVSAMQKEGKAAVAKTVLGTKETLILIRAKGGRMLLNTLYFQDEITSNPAKAVSLDASSAELSMVKQLISSMSGEFNPEDYRDEYRERVRAAIEQKIAGKEVTSPRESSEATVGSLMDALKASLELTKKGAPVKQASERRIPARTPSETKKRTKKPSATKARKNTVPPEVAASKTRRTGGEARV